jgi:hypothetical protein
MKKLLLVAVTLMVSNMAFADMDCRWGIDHRNPRCGPRWHQEHRPPTVIYRDNDNWVAPLIIGGIAGAVIANANQQPVVVQQPQTVIVQTQTVCTAWKEIQQPDGQIYRERTCTK